MRRLNLAARPFQESRPVWVASLALAMVAVVLTSVSLAEFISAKGVEKTEASKLQRLVARRTELAAKVDKVNRQLAAVKWKKLQNETASLQEVVARRKLIWSQLLADLERVVPWNVRLVGITPSVDPKGGIKLALIGYATDRDAWLKLLATLFADDRFSEPLPLSEEMPAATSGKGHEFQLSVRYWPEGRRSEAHR
jgi:hypothetical protein